MQFVKLDSEQLKKAKEEVGDIAKKAVSTDIFFLDDQCHGLLRGKITLFCGSSGHGKSTVLIASSKRVATSSRVKVLYITVEQDISEMIVKINEPDPFIHITRLNSSENIKKQWDEIKKYVIDNKIEFIFYDYIGATGLTDNAVSDMVNEMNTLSDFAIDNNVGIVTACQASLELVEYYLANKDKPKDYLYTNKFIAFSKHIADKASVAFYIIKDNQKSNWIHLFCFKNRYFEHKTKEYQTTLFYEQCEFIKQSELDELMEKSKSRGGIQWS